MQKWEYLVVFPQTPNFFSDDELQKKLDHLGEKEWELIQFDPGGPQKMIFKRRKSEEEVKTVIHSSTSPETEKKRQNLSDMRDRTYG